jgi:hypothetical protein
MTNLVESQGSFAMKSAEKHRDFVLIWEEPAKGAERTQHEWQIEVSSDYPRLLKKLGGHPRCFVAQTRDQALAEARGFVDSLSLT